MERIEISFSQFIDFTLRQGTARITCVERIKHQKPYDPSTDFWKKIRDKIKQIHEKKLNLSELDSLLIGLHETKLKNYTHAINQYKKFCKGKKIEPFEIGKSFWSFENLFVKATPELGLIINGHPYLVKLYFKEISERLHKRNSEISLALMHSSIHSKLLPANVINSMLNVRKNKFILLDKEIDKKLILALEGDAKNFIHIWENI